MESDELSKIESEKISRASEIERMEEREGGREIERENERERERESKIDSERKRVRKREREREIEQASERERERETERERERERVCVHKEGPARPSRALACVCCSAWHCACSRVC